MLSTCDGKMTAARAIAKDNIIIWIAHTHNIMVPFHGSSAIVECRICWIHCQNLLRSGQQRHIKQFVHYNMRLYFTFM